MIAFVLSDCWYLWVKWLMKAFELNDCDSFQVTDDSFWVKWLMVAFQSNWLVIAFEPHLACMLIRITPFLFTVQVEGRPFNATVRTLWEEEGWWMMTKGLSARLVQSVTFSFFIILGYETIKRWSLLDHYKDKVRWWPEENLALEFLPCVNLALEFLPLVMPVCLEFLPLWCFCTCKVSKWTGDGLCIDSGILLIRIL